MPALRSGNGVSFQAYGSASGCVLFELRSFDGTVTVSVDLTPETADQLSELLKSAAGDAEAHAADPSVRMEIRSLHA